MEPQNEPAFYSSDVSSIALEAPDVTIEKSSSEDAPRKKQQQSAPAMGADSVLDRIAQCESKNDPTAKNPRSSASGRFQFLTSSWEAYGRQLWGSTEGKDIFSYEDSTELAEYVYSKEGGTPWNSSKYCWG